MDRSMQEISQETIDLAKQAFAAANAGVQKTGIETALGLVGVDLEAPAKKTYPVLAPLGKRIPRKKHEKGAKQVDWRAVTGINTAGLEAGVAESLINTEITFSEIDKYARYKTLNMMSSVTDEAFWMSMGFEDARALSTLAALQSLQIEEEKYILGGNTTTTGVALGTAPTPTLDVTAAGGCTGTFNVVIVALNLMGYLQRTVDSSGITTAIKTATNKSAKSTAASTGAITSKMIKASWTTVPGAVGYAVYAGAAGSEKLQDVVTANYWDSGTGALTTSGQALTALTDADQSQNVLAFDGIIYQAFATGSGAYIKSLDNTVLTADNAGGVTELDVALKSLWDNRRIGPSLALVNSQEALNITKKVTGGTGNVAGFRVTLQPGESQKGLVGSFFVTGYINKFTSSLTPGNPDIVPFLVHPFLPPGMIVFISETLPYPKPEVASVFEMAVLQPYTAEEFARVTRKYPHGVTTQEALKVYFPAGIAIIYNIKNG
jgi:hypothetical protein